MVYVNRSRKQSHWLLYYFSCPCVSLLVHFTWWTIETDGQDFFLCFLKVDVKSIIIMQKHSNRSNVSGMELGKGKCMMYRFNLNTESETKIHSRTTKKIRLNINL